MTKYTADAHALPYPEGVDKVAVHSDIQALAVKTGIAVTQEGARAEDAAYERAKWKRGTIPAGTDIYSYEGAGNDGVYASLLPSNTATLLNLPEELQATPAAFILTVKTLTNTVVLEIDVVSVYGTVKYVANSSPSTGTGWTPWKRTLMEGDVSATNPQGPASGFRVVPLALTVPASASSTEAVAAASLRFPLRFGATVTRWRLHVRNYNYRGGRAYSGAVNFTGLWLGQGSHGTGNFAATPARVSPAFTTPANGADWASGWINTPINAGVDYLLSMGFTNAAGQENTSSSGGVWRTTVPANASVAAPAQARGTNAPFYIWIEAETSGSTPVIAEVGSSGAAGVGSTLPVLESPLAIYARKIGALPIHYAQPGTTLAVWNDPAHPKWQQWSTLTKPDAVMLTLGSNDVFGSSSLSDIQADHGKVAGIIRDTLSSNLYVGTIPPRTNGDEATRRQMNTWLRTLPNGARDIFEFSAAVSNDDETLRPEYDADGTHTNTAGSIAKADAITRPIVPLALTVQLDTDGVPYF